MCPLYIVFNYFFLLLKKKQRGKSYYKITDMKIVMFCDFTDKKQIWKDKPFAGGVHGPHFVMLLLQANVKL